MWSAESLTRRFVLVLVVVLVLEFGPSGVFEYCALSELHPRTRVGDAGGEPLLPLATRMNPIHG